MCAIASSGGSTPASWKKHGCITVLMRFPMPVSRATWSASITHRSSFLRAISARTAGASSSHTRSAGVRAVQEERRAGLRELGDLGASEQAELVTRDEVGVVDEIRRTDGFRPEPEMRHRHRA